MNDCVRHAIKIGFRVSHCGRFVFGSRGKEVRQHLKGRPSKRYPSVKVWHLPTKTSIPVPTHRLVAYLKFGEESLDPHTVVRHLNDDPTDNSWDNIALGSISDNAHDRPKLDRRQHAQKAGRTLSLPEEIWDKIRADHAEGLGYKKLEAKYGVSRSTLSYRLSKTAKRRIIPLILSDREL